MKRKIVIIADDLTGANDTGAQFAKQGFNTLVILKPEQMETLTDYDCDVVVVDTDSRALPSFAAYQKVAATARFIKKNGYGLIYKKVDSTLRGNLGCEIDAIMDECGLKVAIVAPAFPKNGRTTVNAVQLLKGIPLEATEISKDPKCPVEESNIVKLLSGQTKRTVGHIGIKQMKQKNPEALRKSIEELFKKNVSVIVADIWLDEQFDILAEAASQATNNSNILWVGSAGLAEALPNLIRAKPQAALKTAKPAIVVAGSVSAVTRRQISSLIAQPNTSLIKADAVRLLDSNQSDEYILECLLKINEALNRGRDVALVSGYDEGIVDATKRQGAAMGIEATKISDAIVAGLGKIVNRVMTDKPDIGGFVLTGGDTAVNVCQALSAYGLKIVSEVATGIPLGLLQGGSCHGVPVVTKAGAFGDEDALKKAVESLKEYSLKKT